MGESRENWCMAQACDKVITYVTGAVNLLCVLLLHFLADAGAATGARGHTHDFDDAAMVW